MPTAPSGSRNLFKGSRDFSTSNWINLYDSVYAEDYQGVKIFKKQTLWGGVSQYFEVKTGEEYVFSAYVKSSAKTDRVTFFLIHESKQPMATGLVNFGSAYNQDGINFDLTDEYQRIAIKFKITKDGWIIPRFERYNNDAYLFFGGYKLETGNIATPYSQAPEDLGWSTDTLVPTQQQRYLWKFEYIYYSDGSVEITQPTSIGIAGANGAIGPQGPKGDKGDTGERGPQGIQGLQGHKGDQGIQGQPGADGRTQYTHIAYADNATGGGFSQTDQTKSYIGMYQDFSAADSNDPTKYRWTKWKGSDGAQGIPGKPGADGRTPYIHWAYSDNADGEGLTTSDNGQRYIGNYSDYTQDDSTDKTKYRWADRWAKIDIDGRNLWIQSETTGNFITESLPANHITGQSACYKIFNWGNVTFNIEPDFSSRLYRTVTFSAWVKYENVVQGTNDWNVFNCFKHSLIRKNSSTGAVTTGIDYITLAGFKGTSDWKYISYTYDYSANTSYDQLKTSIKFILEGVTTGVAWITGIMIQLGTVDTGHSPAPEDTQEQIDSKADQTLTQQQLNALAEKNNLIKAEMEAKASIDQLDKWATSYQAYVESNDKDKKEAEQQLIDNTKRIVAMSQDWEDKKLHWSFLDTYMDYSDDGLSIGKRGNSTSLRIDNDRISFYSGGKEVAYFSQGTLQIDNGVFTKTLQIGRYREEQYSGDATINVTHYLDFV